MINSAIGVFLPSVLNFIFVISFVRNFGSAHYDNYVYLLSLTSIPNALLFQPYVARIKTKLHAQEEIIVSLYKWYILLASIIFLIILQFYSTLESFFLTSYALSFSILGLEKTISNIKNKNNWIVFQLALPTVLLLCLLVSRLANLNYSNFLFSLTILFFCILIFLFFQRIKKYKIVKTPSYNAILANAIDKRLSYLIIGGIAIFASTNFFKILIYNQIKNEGFLFNYDILQKICVLYSTFFLVQYSKYVFRKEISPTKILLPYCLGGILLITFLILGFDYMLLYFFDTSKVSINPLVLLLIVTNLLLVGILPILDTYLNSKESYDSILILYVIYLSSSILLYFILSLWGFDIMVRYQLASILSVLVVILTMKYGIDIYSN